MVRGCCFTGALVHHGKRRIIGFPMADMEFAFVNTMATSKINTASFPLPPLMNFLFFSFSPFFFCFLFSHRSYLFLIQKPTTTTTHLHILKNG